MVNQSGGQRLERLGVKARPPAGSGCGRAGLIALPDRFDSAQGIVQVTVRGRLSTLGPGVGQGRMTGRFQRMRIDRQDQSAAAAGKAGRADSQCRSLSSVAETDNATGQESGESRMAGWAKATSTPSGPAAQIKRSGLFEAAKDREVRHVKITAPNNACILRLPSREVVGF